MIMGDFNAHIKNYLEDESDLAGKILVDFIKSKRLLILNDQDMATFKGTGRHTIIDYILSNENSEIKYREVPSLKTNHILLTTEVYIQEVKGKSKTFIPWYKLDGEELKKLQERFNLQFQENNLYQKEDPKEIYNIISQTIQKETLNLEENLKTNYSKCPEVIILKRRINDLRKWIIHCYEEDEKEKAKNLCLIRRKWQRKMEGLENRDLINIKQLENCINDPYRAWNKIKLISGKMKSTINPMNKIQINKWTKEFANQFKDQDIVYLENDFTNENEWTRDEIEKIIKTLPNGKAPGPDNIAYDIIKKIGDCLLDALLFFLNSCRKRGIPNEANESKTVLIYKGKGDSKLLKSYRPITLMNSFMKILDKAQLKRIEDLIEISERQHGFTKGRSCATQIFSLKCCIEYKRAYRSGKSKNLYILFIDFSGAYDSVKRLRLLEKLRNKGVSRDSLTVISQSLRQTDTTLIINRIESEKIPISKGVRQGSSISPLLFNVYIDDLEDNTRNSKMKLLAHEELETMINFQYADDTAFISDSIEDIERILNNLDSWMIENNLSLNIGPEKTAILPILSWKQKYTLKNLRKIYFKDKEIPIVEQYKYLGRIIKGSCQGTGLDHAHFEYLKNKAKSTVCFVLQNINKLLHIPSRILANCFRSIFVPRCTYGLETCSRSKSGCILKNIQTMFNTIIRRACNVYRHTPIQPILLDLGFPSIEQFIDIMSLRFLRKIFDLSINSAVARHFLLNLASQRTPTMKLFKNILEKYELDLPYEEIMSEIKWKDNNWYKKVKDHINNYWNKIFLDYTSKKKTLEHFYKFKTLIFERKKKNEKAWFWKLNQHLVEETRIKAQWRYGLAPVRAWEVKRKNEENLNENCEKCKVRETEEHVLDECPRFFEERREFINRLKDSIGEQYLKVKVHCWMIADLSELQVLADLKTEDFIKVDFITKTNLRIFDEKIRNRKTFTIKSYEKDLIEEGICFEDFENWKNFKKLFGQPPRRQRQLIFNS